MTDKPSTWIRAFVAVNLPPEVEAEVERFQSELKSSLRGDQVRWTPLEQIHLTLRFLGNIAAGSVPDLEAALRRACAGVTQFELAAEGFGQFPEGTRPRILWVGVKGESDTLKTLVGRVVAETQAWGEREDKPFHPHLTIGRVKATQPRELRQLSEELRRVKAPCFGQWRVTQVDLMQSELSPSGAVHTCIAAIPLGEDPAVGDLGHRANP